MREIPQYGKGGWASSWRVCLDVSIFLATLPGGFNKHVSQQRLGVQVARSVHWF